MIRLERNAESGARTHARFAAGIAARYAAPSASILPVHLMLAHPVQVASSQSVTLQTTVNLRPTFEIDLTIANQPEASPLVAASTPIPAPATLVTPAVTAAAAPQSPAETRLVTPRQQVPLSPPGMSNLARASASPAPVPMVLRQVDSGRARPNPAPGPPAWERSWRSGADAVADNAPRQIQAAVMTGLDDVDLGRLTEQVMQTIDRRIVAYRERTGRR